MISFILFRPGAVYGTPDYNHSLMEQRTVKACDRCLLAAVLRRRASENASHLSDKGSASPQASRLVEKISVES